ncbi:MAG: Chromosome partition protein smc [uncultured Sulfurovum sp.]|uniref:Chromosome partition protein smc n=1 Tax=uncultured Sulfurovum sp. TaxID=269237 RepID=A0A6S6TEV8_9BACT|nr:MAG: Chromosome partition protein smc [uncultured Sulfurovum sp.]
MEIKRINIGGNREEINKETGEHRPNLIDTVKRSDLIFTPDQLVQKLFKGSSQEYNTWLMKNKLHPSQVNYHDINQKQELLKKLKIYTMRLLDDAKTDSMFSNELGNIIVTKWLDSFDTLENHVYDLSDFDKVEFIKIADAFKKRFTTRSPFAFLTIDDVNQQLKVVESHKVLLLLDEKLPMGNKRGTPVGQEPEKLYQNLFTTIGYKGKGELTEGLNHHRTNFKNFNFNVNIETRLLNDIIYDTLEYDRGDTQVAFLFGAYGKKLYFESDIKGTERKKEELDALAIAEGATTVIEKELHKERQGSIAVDKTALEVEKRISHPKVNEEKVVVSSVDTTKALEEKNKTVIFESEKKDEPIIEATKSIVVETEKEESSPTISNTLEVFEKEMFIKQQGYAELAKEKINEALTNRDQYINEFHTFLKKGMNVSDALNKFSERYANNPYIKGIIETSITGELQLQALKDKGIEELNHNVNVLKSEKQGLKKDLGVRETEIASLNQSMESLIVSHTKQLEEIEVSVAELVEERTTLIDSNDKQSEMIGELEKLITQYEQTLRVKDSKIEEKDLVIDELKETLSTNEKEYETVVSVKDSEIKKMNIAIISLEEAKVGFIEDKKKQEALYDIAKSELLESSREVESLENEKKNLSRKIDNYDSEIKHYGRQVEQLKEENKLTLSATSLLKTSNAQLELQLETLVDNRNLLESKNSEQRKLNEALSKEKDLLKKELLQHRENKGIKEKVENEGESYHENGFIPKRN